VQGWVLVFFKKYPRFVATSSVASTPSRLNLRHQAIFDDNPEIFEGARVLDIASHDGRWSLAALEAGAKHVTGIEARADLVEHAEDNLAHYGVDDDRYLIIHGDVFDVLGGTEHELEADVVLCLGFLYHTLRYQDLFHGIRSVDPTYLLLDTAVYRSDQAVVRVRAESVERPGNATDSQLAHDGRMLVGRPSPAALELMLDSFGFEVEKKFDWQRFLRTRPMATTVKSYRRGDRVTWLCRRRH
jgi:Methyltransferase domain